MPLLGVSVQPSQAVEILEHGSLTCDQASPFLYEKKKETSDRRLIVVKQVQFPTLQCLRYLSSEQWLH